MNPHSNNQIIKTGHPGDNIIYSIQLQFVF